MVIFTAAAAAAAAAGSGASPHAPPSASASGSERTRAHSTTASTAAYPKRWCRRDTDSCVASVCGRSCRGGLSSPPSSSSSSIGKQAAQVAAQQRLSEQAHHILASSAGIIIAIAFACRSCGSDGSDLCLHCGIIATPGFNLLLGQTRASAHVILVLPRPLSVILARKHGRADETGAAAAAPLDDAATARAKDGSRAAATRTTACALPFTSGARKNT